MKGHTRDRDKEGMRQTCWRSIKESIVAVVFDIFHLCGMVSKDTGACGRQSENAFVVKIISIHAIKNVGIVTTK